jgi:hypothetical protein
MKVRPENVRWLLSNARVPLDPEPNRAPDLVGFGPFGSANMKNTAWVEGAEWMYAGYSPAVPAGCTCPATRPHLDWYKRSFIPEAYRHTIAVLDTDGNLILRIGQYGNLDSASGEKSRIPVGGDGIGLTLPRFISGTDNYLCFDDWGERLVVLKLGYHVEETVAIGVD